MFSSAVLAYPAGIRVNETGMLLFIFPINISPSWQFLLEGLVSAGLGVVTLFSTSSAMSASGFRRGGRFFGLDRFRLWLRLGIGRVLGLGLRSGDPDSVLQLLLVEFGKQVSVLDALQWKKSYCPEHRLWVEDFCNGIEIPKGAVILRDGGGAFWSDGSILEELQWDNHIKYPACVHQLLSPNDNRWHGAAKKRWRESGVNFKDDAAASIKLLLFLDKETHGCEKWFRTNLQVDREEVSREIVEQLVLGNSERVQDYYKRCRRLYRIHVGLDARGEAHERPNDALDGTYWQ